MWFRRADLAQVHRRRFMTGKLQGWTGSWASIGNFLLNEQWEYSPPLEVYDFPTYTGEVWGNDGGQPGAFLTVNSFCQQKRPSRGGLLHIDSFSVGCGGTIPSLPK